MGATAEQVARLRRMVNEASATVYDDEALAEIIEGYPCLDARGEAPGTWNTATQPPTWVPNAGWIETYDLHAAAAEVWEEKAAVLAQDYTFAADGGRYERSQPYEQFMRQARYHQSRRRPGTIKLVMFPKPSSVRDPAWVINDPEPEEGG